MHRHPHMWTHHMYAFVYIHIYACIHIHTHLELLPFLMVMMAYSSCFCLQGGGILFCLVKRPAKQIPQ